MSALQVLVDFLNPFQDARKALEVDLYPTIHHVYHWCVKLQRCMQLVFLIILLLNFSTVIDLKPKWKGKCFCFPVSVVGYWLFHIYLFCIYDCVIYFFMLTFIFNYASIFSCRCLGMNLIYVDKYTVHQNYKHNG